MPITRIRAITLLAITALVLALAACSSGDDDDAGPTTTPPVQGGTIWVAALNSDRVLQIDRETGAILTRVETPGSSPDDVAVGPVGGVLGPGGVNAVDLSTGEVSELGKDFPAGVTASALDPDGTLYVTSFTEPLIVVVDTDGTQRTLDIGG